jgi:hypothetical protein
MDEVNINISCRIGRKLIHLDNRGWKWRGMWGEREREGGYFLREIKAAQAPYHSSAAAGSYNV